MICMMLPPTWFAALSPWHSAGAVPKRNPAISLSGKFHASGKNDTIVGYFRHSVSKMTLGIRLAYVV